MSKTWNAGRARRLAGRVAKTVLPRSVVRWLQRMRGRPPLQIPFGSVRFGDLRRLSPIGRDFGYDRGTPVDRYYIERFLAHHAGDIGGRVLELASDDYTRRFGGSRVGRSDILNLTPSPKATIVGDVTQAETLPEAAFDCIIFTQALQYIYDLGAAIEKLHRALKPGGVLLATAPAVSPVDVRPWYWTFTADSLRRLLEERFGHDAVTVESYGNLFAASAFLYGLAMEELDAADLDADDAQYALTVAARAVKASEQQHSRVGGTSVQPAHMKPLILMYHRIADEPIDYWGLAVSPARFEEQLRVLRRTRRPFPLAEFVRNLTAGTLPPDAVALTFDDGYVDNLVAGLPRLAAADVPATVFLATGYLDRLEPFWWDELASLILVENGPNSFEVVIQGVSMSFDLATESPGREDGTTPVASLQRRHAVLEAIYQPLRRMDEEERTAIMIRLRSIFAVHDDRANLGRAMTSREVRTLVADGLVTIGAHTVTHPVLPELEAAARHREITASKFACEALTGAPVMAFAYPFGEFDAEVREAVTIGGFTFACSTQRGYAVAASDVFALPRIYIPNLDGDAFEERIRSASSTAT